MDSFIRKIFEGGAEGDNLAHIQFQKFGKGTYDNRALVSARKSGAGFSIGTSAEYANELVRAVAEKLGSSKAQVTGAVITTLNLAGQLECQNVKRYIGIKQYQIDRQMSGAELIALLDRFPLAFFALSFSAGDTQLKIKPKAPKSAKPGAKGEAKPKANFCKLATDDVGIVQSVLFDVELSKLKKVEIYHTFVITDIIKPSGITDIAKIRELAKRKGRIIRTFLIDGAQGKAREKEFEI